MRSSSPSTAPVSTALPKRAARARRHDLAAREREAEHIALGGTRRLPAIPSLVSPPRHDAHAAELVPGRGRPLSSGTRARFEHRLGVDLNRVRVHDDHAAAQAAEELSAAAFTVGEDVVLGAEASRPDEAKGEELLAHELTHVAQQQQPGASPEVACANSRGKGGIGRTPPSAPFIKMEGISPEDEHLLFPHDSAELDSTLDSELHALAAAHAGRAVIVRVHGYASSEGDPEYNFNLSAHRAVAVQDALQWMVAPGSTVTAYAHGHTDEFGRLPQNRRVGIEVTQAPITAPSPISPGKLSLSFPSRSSSTPVAPAAPGPSFRLDPETVRRESDPLAPVLRLQVPEAYALDLSAFGPMHASRGVTLDETDVRAYQQLYNRTCALLLSMGIHPNLVPMAAQAGVEAAASMRLSDEYPSRQEELDQKAGSSPSTLSLSVFAAWDFIKDHI